MLSKRFNVPVEICDSQIVEIVGKEQSSLNCRVKPIGEGETLYWCRAVGDDGETFGGTFAVGSDELAKWEELPSASMSEVDLIRNIKSVACGVLGQFVTYSSRVAEIAKMISEFEEVKK